MPIIRAHSGVITQINVFTVPPGNQQPLIDLLVESAEFARSIPGWMSASIHRSLDGTRVVNYAQSDSLDASKRIIDRLREEGYLQRNQALAVANPGLYEVVRTLEI
ncbi:antibiotic biosynthesis monooxygenase [Agrobacterium sp. a22-2]|uniref:antibiotic biosynthesis monooxygenase family protein n=1 Tax=Agrobacterium sp. a22-2 TaxID=2283840 RepID=UPI001447B92E|nr:antibiotic biosynthesis monooxygenase family protein [Agrobacterium sp. a22-2]NKN39357.1 antibiotic biosynthesis monooxygenase [Agrobacterium sp. a22-2]